jgi:hypothetical protein
MIINFRDVERLARSLNANRMDPEYIRHYLQETYLVDNATIDKVFLSVGIGKKKGMQTPIMPKKPTGKREFS